MVDRATNVGNDKYIGMIVKCPMGEHPWVKSVHVDDAPYYYANRSELCPAHLVEFPHEATCTECGNSEPSTAPIAGVCPTCANKIDAIAAQSVAAADAIEYDVDDDRHPLNNPHRGAPYEDKDGREVLVVGCNDDGYVNDVNFICQIDPDTGVFEFTIEGAEIIRTRAGQADIHFYVDKMRQLRDMAAFIVECCDYMAKDF